MHNTMHKKQWVHDKKEMCSTSKCHKTKTPFVALKIFSPNPQSERALLYQQVHAQWKQVVPQQAKLNPTTYRPKQVRCPICTNAFCMCIMSQKRVWFTQPPRKKLVKIRELTDTERRLPTGLFSKWGVLFALTLLACALYVTKGVWFTQPPPKEVLKFRGVTDAKLL
jgi:hypothetical protein